jgi:serine-type D-Ala-D-Ala carboxypeptidase (penicillin-binding protein 5/6)
MALTGAMAIGAAVGAGPATGAGPTVTPATAASASAPPHLAVSGACLAEANSNKYLYTLAANRELPIASTTKLMTALVVLEHEPHLSRMFTQNNYYPATADSQIGLVPGERMSVHDLMLAMMLPSADDAAEDLAYNVGRGSIGRFIGMMNARARQLGLTHTHYSTPIGLDTPGNYSSPCDLVKLARHVLQHEPFFRRVVALPRATLKTGRFTRHIANRNDLVGRVPWINGVKTGHTNRAGYVLVGSASRNGMYLVSAVLGTSSESARDTNTLALLDYGFKSFHLVKPIRQGAVLARPPVKDRPRFHAAVIAGGSFSRIIPTSSRLTTRLVMPRQLVGPLARHAVIGKVQVLVDGRVVGSVPLLLAQRLPAVSKLTLAGRFLTRTTTLLVLLGAVVGAAVGLALIRRERIGGGDPAQSA